MKIGTLKKEEMTLDKEAGEDDEGSVYHLKDFSEIIRYGLRFENNSHLVQKDQHGITLNFTRVFPLLSSACRSPCWWHFYL